MGQLVAYKKWPFTGGVNYKDLTGKIFGVLVYRWSLMRGGQTGRFDCSYVKELGMYDLTQMKAYSRDKYLFETKKKNNKNREREVLIGLLDHTCFSAHVPA